MSSTNDFVIEHGVLTKYTGSGWDAVIPEGVTTIGDGAFSAATACHLTSLQLHPSLPQMHPVYYMAFDPAFCKEIGAKAREAVTDVNGFFFLFERKKHRLSR